MLDYPGCYRSAVTEAEALAQAPAQSRAYLDRLTRHDRTLPTLTRVEEVVVVERFEAFRCASETGYLVNGFFEDDRRPLSYADVALALRLLQWNRETLLAVVSEPGPDELAWLLPRAEDWSVGRILAHIAGAENWYFEQPDMGLDSLQEAPLLTYSHT